LVSRILFNVMINSKSTNQQKHIYLLYYLDFKDEAGKIRNELENHHEYLVKDSTDILPGEIISIARGEQLTKTAVALIFFSPGLPHRDSQNDEFKFWRSLNDIVEEMKGMPPGARFAIPVFVKRFEPNSINYPVSFRNLNAIRYEGDQDISKILNALKESSQKWSSLKGLERKKLFPIVAITMFVTTFLLIAIIGVVFWLIPYLTTQNAIDKARNVPMVAAPGEKDVWIGLSSEQVQAVNDSITDKDRNNDMFWGLGRVDDGEKIAGYVRFGSSNGGYVKLGGFAIEAYEVSNARYRICVDSLGCKQPDEPGSQARFKDPTYANYPVTGITLEDASKFCRTIGRRLPTHVEWQFAARGMITSTVPPIWGWGAKPLTVTLANFNYAQNIQMHPKPIDFYEAGGVVIAGQPTLLNMSGNVAEWTRSYADWHKKVQTTEIGGKPYLDFGSDVQNWAWDGISIPNNINFAVMGGSWLSRPLRPTEQYGRPKTLEQDIGFRCVE
jgi:formylglycine-generating enzyme required for sulfatase activity